MSTVRVVNIQHTDATEPNIVLEADGTTVFASGITISGGTNLTVSGTAEFASGTASAPSITFIDDNDNGIYRPASNQIAFTTNGAEKLRLTNGGRLLLGRSDHETVANANCAFQVGYSAGQIAAVRYNSTATVGGVIAIAKSRNDNPGSYTIVNTGDNLGRITFAGDDGVDLNSRGAQIDCEVDGTPGADDMPGRLVFSTTADGASAPTERMRIDSSGNVGVGTSSPTQALQVAGAIVSTGAAGTYSVDGIYLQNKGSSIFDISAWRSGASASILTFSTDSGSDAAPVERFRIDQNGKVGVGSTSPGYKLEVANDGLNISVATAAGASRGVFQTDGDGFGLRSTYNNAGFITFKTVTGGAEQERVRIDNSGRLLVGTTTDIANNANYIIQTVSTGGGSIALGRNDSTVGTNESMGRITFYGNDGGTYEPVAQIECEADLSHASGDKPGRLVFSTTAPGDSSPTEAFKIDSSQTFYSVPTYNNTIASAANVYVRDNGNFYRSTSSAKYKTNIETLEDSYADALLQCRPVWYRSTCEADNPAHGWWGFIAEEVAEIDPRLVQWKTTEISYDENGSVVETPCDPEPEGVQYDRFVPHLLNLIKRQKEQIEAMEARLSALEAS